MKKFSEITSKQAKICSWICATVISLLFASLICLLAASENHIIAGLIAGIGYSIISIPLLYLMFSLIFNVSVKDYAEENIVAKSRVISNYNLSKENSVKLKFICSELTHLTSFENQLVTAIITNPKFKLTAKLTDTEKIELTAFLDENTIYTQTIQNYVYFEKHFVKED